MKLNEPELQPLPMMVEPGQSEMAPTLASLPSYIVLRGLLSCKHTPSLPLLDHSRQIHWIWNGL